MHYDLQTTFLCLLGIALIFAITSLLLLSEQLEKRNQQIAHLTNEVRRLRHYANTRPQNLADKKNK